jgi:lipid A 4'-phosphatase
MNRTGLIIALSIATVVGLVFGLYPQLDLMISRPFFEYVDASHNVFALRFYPPLMVTRDLALWIPTLLIIPSVIALLGKLILPRRRMPIPGRAVLFLIVTLALGPGLLVNGLLKDHWGRPRPVDVTQFGGKQHFVAWWDPRGDCESNCSFVSGDVSGAFWTIAPAALTPPPWRALAYSAALTLGTGMAIFRVMAGGHFFTDVVFAGVFTFLIVWFSYALIYRWPRTRSTDEGVERVIARFSLTGNIAARWLGHRVADEVAGPENESADADPHIRRRRRGWW